jgi:hypothetical protein
MREHKAPPAPFSFVYACVRFTSSRTISTISLGLRLQDGHASGLWQIGLNRKPHWRKSMSTIDLLRSELKGYLRGSTSIVRKVGSQINVGEQFTLRVTATNVAPSASRVYFTEVSWSVEESEYADLLTPRQEQVAIVGRLFPDRTTLWPGVSTSVDLEFRALRNFGDSFHDLFNAEPIALVGVSGFLDVRRFFAFGSLVAASHEIDPS